MTTYSLAKLDLQGTALRSELAGELPHVHVGAVRLPQALLNLTMTLVQFTWTGE